MCVLLCLCNTGTWTHWDSKYHGSSVASPAQPVGLDAATRRRPVGPKLGAGGRAPTTEVHDGSKYPKAPCSFIVHTWALKGLPYHNFGFHVNTIKLHEAFGVDMYVAVSTNMRLILHSYQNSQFRANQSPNGVS